jgi:N-acetylmuramoyl-L-alanine amidase
LTKTLCQRGLRWVALLLVAAFPGVPAHARTHHPDSWARDRFAAAERMREALNGRPPADRTRHDYQRVINTYRSVYFGAPTSTKADPSVVAVAETLVEMGRRFDDDKILNEAIAQYKFLRKEYPGSKYRCDALFTMGEIYKDDLNDPEHARDIFEDFLHRYPHNRLVEDAQQAIAELDRGAEAEKRAEARKQPQSSKEVADKKVTKDATGNNAAASGAAKAVLPKSDAKTDATAADSSVAHASRTPRVTGIRHWSTPDYTRVAIDLESEIKFGSQRIAHPDRIFFDLRGTKLASTLVGKSFDVDDGFLKKIRVAQFQPGRTRVVLEVDDLSDYDAFLLPNPYRLIIDIHGKDSARAKSLRDRDKDKDTDQAVATGDLEAPPQAGLKANAISPEAAGLKPGSTKPDVPKSELKADLKALAGKPVSKKEQIHGEPNADAKADGSAEKLPAVTPKGAEVETGTIATKTSEKTSTPIKKVIVEADDDDPAEAAKADAPGNRSHLAGSRKIQGSNGPSVSDEEASTDPVPSTHTTAKSHSASGRKPGDLQFAEKDVPEKDLRNSRDVREARPTASGDRSLIRALGLKIGKIVIDPGHGGHDTGTIGPNGLEEKDLVLEVGRRLGKMLETRLGAEVVYTRKDDTFIPLETRTAIANQQRADLFISIHANSSHDADARGVETYYLNFTSSPEALEVAARENAVSEKSIYELQDLVKKIALKEKIEESREFAGDVQESLHSGLAAKSPGIRDRGVKKAPFIVLIGANMPSILAEISFVSNPGDEHHLETSEYRQRIAESLYRGIAKYVNGLSGVKVASKMDRAAGQ